MDTGLALVILGELAFVAFVLWLAAPFVRERARRRAELQTRVIEKFADAAEFVAFLDSEAGARFQDALSGRRTGALLRVMSGLQLGCLLVSLGIGLALAWRAIDPDPTLLVAAFVFIALGVGFVAAAGVSYWLGRTWVLDRERR